MEVLSLAYGPKAAAVLIYIAESMMIAGRAASRSTLTEDEWVDLPDAYRAAKDEAVRAIEGLAPIPSEDGQKDSAPTGRVYFRRDRDGKSLVFFKSGIPGAILGQPRIDRAEAHRRAAPKPKGVG
jgi:hypothetical protein